MTFFPCIRRKKLKYLGASYPTKISGESSHVSYFIAMIESFQPVANTQKGKGIFSAPVEPTQKESSTTQFII